MANTKYIELFSDPVFNKSWIYVSEEIVVEQLGYSKSKDTMHVFNTKLIKEFEKNIDYKEVDSEHELVQAKLKNKTTKNDRRGGSNKKHYIITGKTYATIALSRINCNKQNSIEKKIQMHLKQKLNAKIEIRTPVGCIDLLSDSHIIEIKEARSWKNALGQVLCYSEYYPDKKKKIILFGNTTTPLNIMQKVCNKYDVDIEIFNEKLTK